MQKNDRQKFVHFLRTTGLILLAVSAVLFGIKHVAKIALKEPSSGTHAEFKVGDHVPDFELVTFPDSKRVKMSALDGKIFVLNFWATWCEACLIEMPTLEKLNAEFSGLGVKVLAVSVDEDAKASITAMLQKKPLKLAIFYDDQQKLSDLFDVHAIPFTVIMNKERRILHVESGERDWMDAEMQKKLGKWLSE